MRASASPGRAMRGLGGGQPSDAPAARARRVGASTPKITAHQTVESYGGRPSPLALRRAVTEPSAPTGHQMMTGIVTRILKRGRSFRRLTSGLRRSAVLSFPAGVVEGSP